MRLSLFLVIIFYISFMQAENVNKPLWEFGLLGGVTHTPHYPGSEEFQVRGLALPNVRYRGKIFRNDENEGARARLNEHKTYKFDMSIGGSFNSSANETQAREGMLDLGYTLEAGPRLKVILIEKEKKNISLDLIFPLRFVVETNFSYYRDRGLTFKPGFQVSRSHVFCEACDLFFRWNLNFATKRYYDLFYEVISEFSTNERKTYEAQSGYNGQQIFGGYVVSLNKFQSFLGVSYSSYRGSDNQSSPLIKKDEGVTVILGLGWLFWESQERGFK